MMKHLLLPTLRPTLILQIAIWTVVFAGLTVVSNYSYLLFYFAVEGFYVVIACAIFLFSWHTRRMTDNHYFVFLGIGYLFVGLMDSAHALSCTGRNVFNGFDSNIPAQLWLGTRYMESFTLLLSPFMIKRKVSSTLLFSAFFFITIFLLAATFVWQIFPVCYIEGQGLTFFKKTSEYFICLVLSGSIYVLSKKQAEFAPDVFKLLILSIFIAIGAELAFTFYLHVYSLSNQFGHFLKIISFYCLYLAVIKTGLTNPYSLIFRNLKESLARLQEREIRYRTLFMGITDALFVHEVSIDGSRGCFLEVNDVACQRLGYHRDELLQMSPADIEAPGGPGNSAAIAKRLAAGKDMTFEQVHLTRDGKLLEVEIHAKAHVLEDKPVVMSIARDISERKKAEQLLRENKEKLQISEERFALAVQGTTDGLWDWSVADNKIWFSEQFKSLLGYAEDEMSASFEIWESLLHPEDQESAIAAVNAHLLQRHPYNIEYRLKDKSGIYRWFLAKGQAIWDENGEPVRMAGSIRDITDRKQTEILLKLNQARMEALQQLTTLTDLSNHEIADFAMRKGVELTQSNGGFVGFINDKGDACENVLWSKNMMELCSISEKPLTFPLLNAGLWAEAIRQRKPVVVNDYSTPSLLKKGTPEGHLPFTSFLGIPIMEKEKIVAVAGVANKKAAYDDDDVQQLSLLMHGMSQHIQRKQALQGLQESEKRYRALVEDQVDYVSRFLPDGTLTFVNRPLAELAGKPSIELLGQNLFEFLDKKTAVRLRKSLQGISSENTSASFEDEISLQDGRTVWQHWINKGIFDAQGKLVEIQGAGRNITDLKIAQKRQAIAKESAEKLISQLNERVKELDCLFGISRLVEKNISLNEIIQGVVDLIPSSWQYSEITCAQIKLNGKSFKTKWLREGPWVQKQDITLSGEKIGSVNVYYHEEMPVRDEGPFLKQERDLLNAIAERLGQVIEHAHTMAALKKSQELYQQAEEMGQTGHWERDFFEDTYLWSSGAYRIFGVTADQFSPTITNLLALIHPDDRAYVELKIHEVQHVEKLFDFEYRIIRPDGAVRFIHSQGEIVVDPESNFEKIVGVVHDITDSKNQEEERNILEIQLRHAHKMQAVGTLAGGIAHEFNNLLGVILGSVDMAERKVPSDSLAKEQLDRALRASFRAKDLVKQILTFSRKKTDRKLTPVNLAAAVKSAMAFVSSSMPSSIDYKLFIAENCNPIMADSSEISQIMMNLCGNAFHAMSEKGILVVRLEQIDLRIKKAAKILRLKIGQYLKLSVSDTGEGMDVETKERVFEPFFTTKEVGQGIGMGLATVLGIMESYGGTITVDSEVEKGTVFFLYFPIIKKESARHEKTHLDERRERQNNEPVGNENILFVDDQEMQTETSKEMLEELGYSVTAEMNSEKALNLFRSSPEKYDLVITDQIMPRLSGDELATNILAIRPDIPIIICTGYSTQIDREKVKSIGGREFMMKPLIKKDVANLIRKVLDD